MSTIVVLTFGADRAASHAGLARFAAVQTAIELHRSTLRVATPPGLSGRFPPTTVAYDVGPDGRVDRSSIQFVAGGDVDAQRRDHRCAAWRPVSSAHLELPSRRADGGADLRALIAGVGRERRTGPCRAVSVVALPRRDRP